MQSDIKNVMCVDMEDWFHCNLDVSADIQPHERRAEENTRWLLEIFDLYQVQATFFVVGDVAKNHPALVKEVHARGHEIGCHSAMHRLVYELTPEQFQADTHRAKVLLEDLVGAPVTSYRAPSWSITEAAFWALEVLEKEGFTVDSSIFPFKNFLYGVKNAPRFPYRAERYSPGCHILECPPSTVQFFGQTIPFSGGFYLRVLPQSVVKTCISHLNQQGQPAVMYIHPWELDPATPRMKLNIRDTFIKYWGIRGNEKKLRGILKSFSFQTLLEYAAEFR